MLKCLWVGTDQWMFWGIDTLLCPLNSKYLNCPHPCLLLPSQYMLTQPQVSTMPSTTSTPHVHSLNQSGTTRALRTSWGSMCVNNQTTIPLVYVISQPPPLYWGIIHPLEWVQRKTGPFWFMLIVYPYQGGNVPTNCEVVASHARDVLGFLLGGCMLTETLIYRGPLMSYGVGIATGAYRGIVVGEGDGSYVNW